MTLDWRGPLASRYRHELIGTLEARGYAGFGDAIEVSRLVTPADWADQGLAAGTPFAAAHTPRQTGPFRPGNLHPTLGNVVFVGSGTQPGVGVPMVLISGRLAAERVTGGRR
jgi:phytoene desaturase